MTAITLVWFLILSVSALGIEVESASRDHVIIGGGTAGCAIAARLCAALPSHTSTLLERGIPRNTTADFLGRAPNNLSMGCFHHS